MRRSATCRRWPNPASVISSDIQVTEPGIPWRELAGFRNVIVHGYLGMDIAAVWLVIEQDLPALAAAVDRMIARAGPSR